MDETRLCSRSRWINHLSYFGYFRRGKAADLGMFADYGFVLGKVDTEGFVVRNEALNPLNVGAELLQHLIRFRSGFPELLPLEKVPTLGISLSITNLRSAIVFLL